MKVFFTILLVSLMLGACGKSAIEKELLYKCTHTNNNTEAACECFFDELDIDFDDIENAPADVRAMSAAWDKCRDKRGGTWVYIVLGIILFLIFLGKSNKKS
ncbi:MAG: hypothetical protein LBB76_06135 [Azoarcus sp.]|nr:hypothetical protein [Azoarcus sp.]